MLKKTIKISRQLTIGPQPTEEQLKQLARRGFKKIVNLQNKGEIEQLYSPDEEGQKVEKLGMKYVSVPLFLAGIKEVHVEEFCSHISEGPHPVYVHCRLGQRCIPLSLIYHALRKKLSIETIMSKTKKWGITFSSPFLESLIKKHLKKYEA